MKQVVFLTGASAGIGQATAKMLVDAGAVVYGASRRAAQAYQNQQSGGEFVPVQLDVNDEIQLGSAVQRIVEERGCLNVVVANAGNGLAGSVEDASSEEVKYQFETNFFGVVKTIQACLPVFRSQGYGRVIAVSSVAAL
jgi:NADP-dependent 3-hydroxy acid dehydrogenase YdfG